MNAELVALLGGVLVMGAALLSMVNTTKERAQAVAVRLQAMAGTQTKAQSTRLHWIQNHIRLPECQAALAAMIGALALGWFLKLNWIAELFFLVVMAVGVWVIVRRWRFDKARKAFLLRFPEAIDNFTRSIQAGIPVDRALQILGEAYDDELGSRITKLCQEMRVGLPFREALHNFAADLDNADVDFFCEVLALNRETGSPLSPMLVSLSQMLSERRSIDRKLKALTSESRASARVLCLLPLFILGLQAFLNPSQVMFLVNDPTGRVVTGYCLVSMLAGFIVIQRMSRSLNG